MRKVRGGTGGEIEWFEEGKGMCQMVEDKRRKGVKDMELEKTVRRLNC